MSTVPSFIAAVAVAGAVFTAGAYDYTIVNNHADLLYSCGEKATFTVAVKDGENVPSSGVVTAKLDNTGPNVFAEETWDLSKTNVFTIAGTMKEPGFLRLKLFVGEKEDRVWSVGYEPERIRKGSPSPRDFDSFWAEARAKAAKIPLDPQVEEVPERTTDKWTFYKISFVAPGRRVYGFMSVPKDKSKAPFPVDFGVNAAGFGFWTNSLWSRDDSICVQFSVYPFEMSYDWEKLGFKEKYYDKMNKERCDRFGGWSYENSGISSSREDYFFYPVILGIDRAVDWVAARPDVDRKRFRYQGTSQGGGMGIALCGLNRNFTKAAFFVPAITDIMGYEAGRQSGWPFIVEANSFDPEKKAAAIRNAPYFDAANFASRIKCPVRIAVGFSDTTCPPSAVYATYNEIKVKDKAILNGIGMTHGCFGEFYTKLGDWTRE